jgi:hypothetical protein
MTEVSEEQPVNTWKLIFMKQKTRRHWSMGLRDAARYRTACSGKFAAVCLSNRTQLDFSGMSRAATYGTAGNVNALVEIAGFDFSGTVEIVRYRDFSSSIQTPRGTVRCLNATLVSYFTGD